VPPRTSTLRLLDGELPSNVVPAGAKRAVVAEAKRALHPVKVAWVAVDAIDATPAELNSRQAYDEAGINELASSIQAHGILQPLCVRPSGDRYTVVFGLRRLMAARRAGLAEVPCSIRVADDDRAFLLNAIENLHRRQLSGAERVRTIEKLAATELSVRVVGQRTGFHPATIARWLRIDRRPILKAALEQERLDIGRAMVLAQAPEEAVGPLLEEASGLPQAELWQRVAELRASHNATPRTRLNARRLLEALRLLTLVDRAEREERGLAEQIHDVTARLLGWECEPGSTVTRTRRTNE
jgi:ParB/RepB/Spo0J family partition protein